MIGVTPCRRGIFLRILHRKALSQSVSRLAKSRLPGLASGSEGLKW